MNKMVDVPSSSFRREPLQLRKGNSFVRLLTARTVAKVRKVPAADVAALLWPNDKVIERLVTRAVAPPAMTTVTGWAAELAQTVIRDALEALGAVSAGAQMLSSCLVLTFDGAGVISAPGFVADANHGGFVAEGNPIPVRQFAAEATTLQPHKLASIGVLTREMIESSNAEQMIGDVLTRSAGLALDAVLFGSAAATAAAPAGLRNGISTLTASTSTELYEAFFQDVAVLINAVSAVGNVGPYAMIASPGRAAQMLMRFVNEMPNLFVYGSTAVGNDLIAVACPGIVAALDPEPEIETSNAAALHMQDTPAALVTSPGVSATPVRSLYQTDSIAVKVRWPVTWALRDPRAVAWLTPTWT